MQRIDTTDLLVAAMSWLKSRNVKGKTHYYYERSARCLVRYFGPVSLSAITVADVERYMGDRSSVPHSCNHEIRVGRSIYRYANKRGWVWSNPFALVDTFPEGGHTRRALTRKEVARAFLWIRRFEEMGRLRRGRGVAFRLCFYTGARVMEIIRLRWEDVELRHPDGPRLLLREHKTSRHTGGRTIELHHEAAALLQRLERTSEWCFPPARNGKAPSYPWRLWHDLMEAADIELPKGEATHACRITFATRGLDAEVAIGDVMDALGHCDPKTTARYQKYSSKAARRAMSKIRETMFGDDEE